mgnify:CR=1 FL=1
MTEDNKDVAEGVTKEQTIYEQHGLPNTVTEDYTY